MDDNLKANKKSIFDEYEKNMVHNKRIIYKTPEKNNNEIKKMTKGENSCCRVNNNSSISTSQNKGLFKKEAKSKSNENYHSKIINDNNEGISIINESKNVEIKEDKNKNLQLKYFIAKCFEKLDDDKMIEVMVFIENIQPQSIKLLSNDSAYINFEAFTDETFTKVFEFVKKYFN